MKKQLFQKNEKNGIVLHLYLISSLVQAAGFLYRLLHSVCIDIKLEESNFVS